MPFNYALTINMGHPLYDIDIDKVVNNIIIEFQPSYINLVNHNDDHYHALVCVDDFLIKSKNAPCHFELVRMFQAYIKYMYNHDVLSFRLVGEMPYYEDDSMIDYLLSNGYIKTVQKFGWQALKYYSNIKQFYYDFKGESSHEKN